MKRNILKYTSGYLSDYSFEKEMVHYRSKLVLDRLQYHSPQNILELGCGYELQSKAFKEQGGNWESWTIVEPSNKFAEIARDSGLKKLHIIEDFFENTTSLLKQNSAPDLIICSGLLHEVCDANIFIKKLASIMDANTILHVNVPNAKSFHRRLAVCMGISNKPESQSQRNLLLQQPRVYELQTLSNDLEEIGLKVIESGGFFIKPFTHEQMSSLDQVLNRKVLDGLDKLGRQHPDWASEIFLEAILK